MASSTLCPVCDKLVEIAPSAEPIEVDGNGHQVGSAMRWRVGTHNDRRTPDQVEVKFCPGSGRLV